MQIFKDGRAPFLEFLRNLTPQSIIFSFALVAGNKLQPTCCYPENWKQTVIFSCYLSIWFLATWANSSLFIEKYLATATNIDKASRLLKRLGVSGCSHLIALLKFSWRTERLIFIESILVFIVVEFGLVTVVLTAVSSASAFMKLLHH